MDRKRIGNIEVRTIQNYNGESNTEIICWYPNYYYGRQREYQKVSTANGTYYINPEYPNHHISASCFINQESCYVVAFVEECQDDEPDICSVGSRPFRLEDEDRDNFLQIVDYIYESYEAKY